MAYRVRSLIAGLAAAILSFNIACAHDFWISRQGLKNAAGEWCCGAGDCGAFVGGSITPAVGGYQVDATYALPGQSDKPFRVVEFVPYAEAQPSPDGAYWRCHRPDGSRRCFFAPPPGS